MFSSKLQFDNFQFEGGYGSEVIYLESAFKSFSGRSHNIAVSSATAAADMIFSWLRETAALTIYVPTLTFCSPAMMALKNGHRVCLTDVNYDLLQNTWGDINMPVMYGGAAHNKGSNCLIVDAAHNPCTCHITAKYVFTSFYPTKPLRCLNGGMISTDDDGAADYFLKYRNFGRHMGGNTYKIEQAGNKYYLDKFNAAIVLEQLKGYQATVLKRKANFQFLQDSLKGGRLTHHDENSSYYFASFIFDDKEKVTLAKAKLLEKCNLNCPLHYPLLHEQPFFKHHQKVYSYPCPNAEELSSRLLNLPLAEYHPQSLYEDIVNCLRSL